MAESNSPKSNGDVFTKKVQRQISRSKEKVLQKLGKSVVTRDEKFEECLQKFNEQQTDGNRITKDLKNYLNAVRDMHEASKRLSQSLYDAYETDWAGEEDLGAFVEGEDLLWNDYEVKISDQAVLTTESYIGQFPEIRKRVYKRGRKLIDYDASRHHLETLQTAKKKDDVKIAKAEEDVNTAKHVYESINNELKEELPALYESRIGCYVAVFSAIAALRDIFYKEMGTLNNDLHSVMKELQAEHPEKVFVVKDLLRYSSLKRRSLMSPRSWKSSFSDFHMNYSPKPGGQRSSFKSPDKPRRFDTMTRESSTLSVSLQSPPHESPSSDFRGVETESINSGTESSVAKGIPSEREDATTRGAGEQLVSEVNGNLGGGDTPPLDKHLSTPDTKAKIDNPVPSDSSSEPNNSCDSESLELQLSAVGSSTLYIEEKCDILEGSENPCSNGLKKGEVSGVECGVKENILHPVNCDLEESKSTVV